MKIQFAIVIGAILVGSLATVNFAFVSDNEVSANSFKNSAGMLGHVTLTALDEDGNVISYRQTDNVVINSGDDCIGQDIFGGSWGCGSTTDVYDDVHIGTTQTSFTETSGALTAFDSTTGGTVGTPTTAAGTGGASVTITAEFLDVSASIAEAALKNSPSSTTGDVLALQSFSPISLGPSDDLTIEWTVTIDGN